jgi:LacI family transcriptional regulator
MPVPRKRVTLFDICRKADVSSATVSRVINESPLVQEDTRRKVLKAIREMGYRPSHAARMLARQRTETIGVILPDLNSQFQAQILAGIDQVADEAHHHMLTAFTHGGRDARRLLRRMAEERRVDAAIFVNLQSGTESLLRDMARLGLPLVLLDRPVAGFPSVVIDNESGARLAMEHLLKLGHRRIAFLQGPEGNYDAGQRLAGALTALEACGCSLPDELRWRGDFAEDSGAAAVAVWGASGRPWPEAIFACNDTMAFGVLTALRERGLRVPEDVAVMGFDDSLGARWIGLSTVRIPVRELGYTAARMALQLSRRELPDPPLVRLPVELLVRQTCGGSPS